MKPHPQKTARGHKRCSTEVMMLMMFKGGNFVYYSKLCFQLAV